STVTPTVRSKSRKSSGRSRASAADSGSATGRASSSSDAGQHFVLWITRGLGVGLGRNRPERHSVPVASPADNSADGGRGRAPASVGAFYFLRGATPLRLPRHS